MTCKLVSLLVILILILSASVAFAADDRIDKIKVEGNSYSDGETEVVYIDQVVEVYIELDDEYSDYLFSMKSYDSNKLRFINETQNGIKYRAFFIAKSTGDANITIYINNAQDKYSGQTTVTLDIKRSEDIGDIEVLSPDSTEGDARVFFSASLDLPKSVMKDQGVVLRWTVKDETGRDVIKSFSGNNITKTISEEGLFYGSVEAVDDRGMVLQNKYFDFYVVSAKNEIDISHMSSSATLGQSYNFNLTGTSCKENYSIYVYDGQKEIKKIDYKKGEYNDLSWTYVFKEAGAHFIKVEIRQFAKKNPLDSKSFVVTVSDLDQQGQVDSPYVSGGSGSKQESVVDPELLAWAEERRREREVEEASGFSSCMSILILILAFVFSKKKK